VPCVGNSYRRDDGIGPAVVGAVSEINPEGVTLGASDGELAELIEAWTGGEHVVLVDAMSGSDAVGGEAVPGRIHRRVLVPRIPGDRLPGHRRPLPAVIGWG
jgi:hydrogenase maturation protease